MHRGYVKLWRRLLDNGMLSDGPLCQVFLKGILDTAHSTTIRRVCGQDITLQPGEFIYGRKSWAHDLKMTEKVLRRRIQDLLESDIIEHSPCENPGQDEGAKRASTWAQERASKRASTYTVFRFVNWDTYQHSSELEGQQKGQQKGQHSGEARAPKGPHLKNKKNEKKKDKKDISFVEGAPPLRLATYLFNCIRLNRPDFKQPDLQSWSRHVDLMIRIDKRDPDHIREVIKWAQSDNVPSEGSGFCWAANILSTQKLRKQYDQLAIKMSAANMVRGGSSIADILAREATQ